MKADKKLYLEVSTHQQLDQLSKKLGITESKVAENAISLKHSAVFNSEKNILGENNSLGNKEIDPKNPPMDFSDDYSEKVNKMIATNKHEFRVIGFMPKVSEWCNKMQKRGYDYPERHEVLLRLAFEAIAYARSKNKSIAKLAEYYPKHVLTRLMEVEKTLGLEKYTTMEELNAHYDKFMGQIEDESGSKTA